MKTNKRLKQLQLMLSTLFLFICIPSTGHASDSYHALDKRYVGYSEEETGLANFDIHYSGRWKQSHEMIGRYGLFRSAELASEMGFPAFSIESFALSDEPDVQIYRTCSDIRVVSDSIVPAASVSVHYLSTEPELSEKSFSVRELIQIKALLLDKNKRFDLHAFLETKGVNISDERLDD